MNICPNTHFNTLVFYSYWKGAVCLIIISFAILVTNTLINEQNLFQLLFD